MTKPLYILNGPNLNLLGRREPHIYGTQTLADIEKLCREKAQSLGASIEFRQTNHEGELLDWLHEAKETGCAVVLNAAGLTHTSVALYDAIMAIGIPVIEAHISNPHARETFRHHSYVSLAARGVVAGFGAQSYLLAIEGALAFAAKAAQ